MTARASPLWPEPRVVVVIGAAMPSEFSPFVFLSDRDMAAYHAALARALSGSARRGRPS